MMSDLAHNSPPEVKIPTLTIIMENNKTYIYIFKNRTPLNKKLTPHSILQVPTTQLVNMSIDPIFVELTADALKIFL